MASLLKWTDDEGDVILGDNGLVGIPDHADDDDLDNLEWAQDSLDPLDHQPPHESVLEDAFSCNDRPHVSPHSAASTTIHDPPPGLSSTPPLLYHGTKSVDLDNDMLDADFDLPDTLVLKLVTAGNSDCYNDITRHLAPDQLLIPTPPQPVNDYEQVISSPPTPQKHPIAHKPLSLPADDITFDDLSDALGPDDPGILSIASTPTLNQLPLPHHHGIHHQIYHHGAGLYAHHHRRYLSPSPTPSSNASVRASESEDEGFDDVDFPDAFDPSRAILSLAARSTQAHNSPFDDPGGSNLLGLGNDHDEDTDDPTAGLVIPDDQALLTSPIKGSSDADMTPFDDGSGSPTTISAFTSCEPIADVSAAAGSFGSGSTSANPTISNSSVRTPLQINTTSLNDHQQKSLPSPQTPNNSKTPIPKRDGISRRVPVTKSTRQSLTPSSSVRTSRTISTSSPSTSHFQRISSQTLRSKADSTGSKIMKKPKAKTVYGDGTELDGIEDLPVASASAKYKSQNNRFSSSNSIKISSSKLSAAPHTPLSQSFANRSVRRQTPPGSTMPQTIPRVVTSSPIPPVMPSRSANTSSSSLASSSGVPPRVPGPQTSVIANKKTLKRQKKVVVGHIQPIGQNPGGGKSAAALTKANTGMVYNPILQKWEGNEDVLKDFDRVTPVKPLLIRNIGGHKRSAIENGMVFDPVKMCWLGNDQYDPFADIANLSLVDVVAVAPSAESMSCNPHTNQRNQPISSEVETEFDIPDDFKTRLLMMENRHKLFVGNWYPRAMHESKSIATDTSKAHLYELWR
ncbi:hypothetical protein SeMB42_g04267 [Synchytrium endobioticum]|uniref:Uncharacterized protein n=1 Tax=Synchytrium endobioticum TaxID=286115 RepID=A0A507CH95_9FUNG|nr:hypothetical protein SeLEV6574_g07557 [Synchytrium endobioticum]TPX44598.1 hypothetical protein SeMB42_g04267 [Synchytrium endobioticum]